MIPMTTDRTQPQRNPLKHRHVLNAHQWRNATRSSRQKMERRQLKLNRVAKRLCHTRWLSHARRDKMILIEMAE
jgi:hypothetical protein